MKPRAIKIRVWDKKNKIMHKGENLLSFPHDSKGLYYRASKRKAADFVLMQWTGFKDGRGREIYEGDLILDFDDAVGKVQYSKGFYLVNWNDDNYSDLHLELDRTVVGNIYQGREK